MNALLIVDVQRDFCVNGALEVPHGDRVVPVINRLMPHFSIVVASQDWHPADSKHFEKWPPHCIQNTPGAELHPDLDKSLINQVFRTGTHPDEDGYSAFDAEEDLAAFLRTGKTTSLYVCGLATEYCVRASALDAARHGFDTWIVTDAVAALDSAEGERTLQELERRGIRHVKSNSL